MELVLFDKLCLAILIWTSDATNHRTGNKDSVFIASGGTATLPCCNQEVCINGIRWRKNADYGSIAILTKQNQSYSRHDRFELVHEQPSNNGLKIKNISSNDEGKYCCDFTAAKRITNENPGRKCYNVSIIDLSVDIEVDVKKLKSADVNMKITCVLRVTDHISIFSLAIRGKSSIRHKLTDAYSTCMENITGGHDILNKSYAPVSLSIFHNKKFQENVTSSAVAIALSKWFDTTMNLAYNNNIYTVQNCSSGYSLTTFILVATCGGAVLVINIVFGIIFVKKWKVNYSKTENNVEEEEHVNTSDLELEHDQESQGVSLSENSYQEVGEIELSHVEGHIATATFTNGSSSSETTSDRSYLDMAPHPYEDIGPTNSEFHEYLSCDYNLT